MKKLLVLAIIGGSLTCTQARAQERVGSAAIGVVAGALILGPVGAIAGGLVGYTAGPEMSRGLTAEQPRERSRARRSARSGNGSKRATAANANMSPKAVAPSQQSIARAPDVAPPVAKPGPSIGATQPMPPIQSLD
jgi:hypothetical protein